MNINELDEQERYSIEVALKHYLAAQRAAMLRLVPVEYADLSDDDIQKMLHFRTVEYIVQHKVFSV